LLISARGSGGALQLPKRGPSGAPEAKAFLGFTKPQILQKRLKLLFGLSIYSEFSTSNSIKLAKKKGR